MPTSLKQQLGGDGGLPIGGVIESYWTEDKVTLADGTVWLKAGVIEENTTNYPEAPTVKMVNPTTIATLDNVAGSGSPDEKPTMLSGNGNFVFIYYPKLITDKINYVRRYSTTGLLQKYTAPFAIEDIAVNSTHVWALDGGGLFHQFDMQFNATGVTIDIIANIPKVYYRIGITDVYYVSVTDDYIVVNIDSSGGSQRVFILDLSGKLVREFQAWGIRRSDTIGSPVDLDIATISKDPVSNTRISGASVSYDYHGNQITSIHEKFFSLSDNAMSNIILRAPSMCCTEDRAYFVTYKRYTDAVTNDSHYDTNIYMMDTQTVIAFNQDTLVPDPNSNPKSLNIGKKYMRIA